jgi:hypothetical protein
MKVQSSGFKVQGWISPNPVQDNGLLVLEGFREGGEKTFRILDNLGREIFLKVFTENQTGFIRSSLPSGIYIWQVTGKEGTVTGKLALE